jgi:hypothetical protein
VNVERAPEVAVEPTAAAPVAATPYNPPPRPAGPTEEQRFANRYGSGFGTDAGAAFRSRYGIDAGGVPKMAPPPQPVQPAYVPPPQPKAMQTVIDEKQLRVTMLIQVVKLVSAPGPGTPRGTGAPTASR